MKATKSVTIGGKTYTVGQWVRCVTIDGTVSNILHRIITHRNGLYTFVMVDGDKANMFQME